MKPASNQFFTRPRRKIIKRTLQVKCTYYHGPLVLLSYSTPIVLNNAYQYIKHCKFSGTTPKIIESLCHYLASVYFKILSIGDTTKQRSTKLEFSRAHPLRAASASIWELQEQHWSTCVCWRPSSTYAGPVVRTSRKHMAYSRHGW